MTDPVPVAFRRPWLPALLLAVGLLPTARAAEGVTSGLDALAYPADGQRCLVVATSGSPGAEGKAAQFIDAVNEGIGRFTMNALLDRHYQAYLHFDPSGKPADPSRRLRALADRHCARMLQVAMTSSKEGAAQFITYEVTVMRFRRRSMEVADRSLETLPDYTRKYRYEWTDDFARTFILSDFGEQVVLDLQRDGAVPGLHEPGVIAEEDLHAVYDIAAASLPEEFHVRHILVEQEATARRALERLRAGAYFEDLARELSADPGSADKGGDLDWGPADNYTPTFAQAVTRQRDPGLIAAPVKTPFGWHVIEVLGRRAGKMPPFAEVRGRIEKGMRDGDEKRAGQKKP